MDGMPIDLYLFSLMKNDHHKLRIDTHFWAITGLVTAVYPIRFLNGHKLTQEGCFIEIEECVMEEQMTPPRTWDEFLFWSWNQNTYECYDGYDESWRLRHAMMQYHYKQNFLFS
jgi:hypothetical protein